MKTTIQSAQQTWMSPDGQRKLYEVTYTNESGGLVKVKTWSGKIGTGIGQQFDLEEYTKDGNRGPETFVRQLQAEGSQYANRPAGGSSGASSPASSPDNKQFRGDPDTRSSIERQTALKAAVEVVANYWGTVGALPKEGYDLAAYVEDVKKYAKELLEVASAVPEAVSAVFPGAEAVAPAANEAVQAVQDSLV